MNSSTIENNQIVDEFFKALLSTEYKGLTLSRAILKAISSTGKDEGDANYYIHKMLVFLNGNMMMNEVEALVLPGSTIGIPLSLDDFLSQIYKAGFTNIIGIRKVLKKHKSFKESDACWINGATRWCLFFDLKYIIDRYISDDDIKIYIDNYKKGE